MRVTPGPVSGGHNDLIERASFAPDGERFVAGDLSGGLMVRTRGGEITAKLRVPPAGQYSKPQVRAVAWSPDGSRIAVNEYGGVRLRRPADLLEEAEAKSIGTGPLAFGGGGRWLAVLAQSSVYVRGIPAFDALGLHVLSRGTFEYFTADTLAADPHGSLIAAGDDGGCDETAMGARTAQGEPQVTLIDAERGIPIGAIERGHPVFGLAFDPWRGRLLCVLHRDVGAWSRTGEAIARFAPYPNAYARGLAVSERWIATAPDTGDRARIDFFDPETYERLATVDLPGPISPSWIAASPDGRTFVTPEIPKNRDFAVRIWIVEQGRAINIDACQ
jgi:WD40 repeat protein